ncbi:hypothetical protein ACJMK2_040067 [Sinanodonta woodiana]|uniref:Uncharacterized protein n=1 Tax=Sinanodonta woodiana TaxID=1069815 RepID=A0ABD3WF21_SINWO
MNQRRMMVIFFLFGFVLGAISCSEKEFKCQNGKCIEVTKQCNGFPDCLDKSDAVAGCGAECVLNDLKKFLDKHEPAKAVYQSGDTIRLFCPIDDDDDYEYGYAYDYNYNFEEASSVLTCSNGRWLGNIPKCIGNADSSMKSTPKTDVDVVTNTNDVAVTQYVPAVSTSNARSESDHSRDDDSKTLSDIGFNARIEELYAYKVSAADCELNGLNKYFMKTQTAEKTYLHGQKIIIACPDSDDHGYNYDQLSNDSHSELTCHDGQWIGSYPECFNFSCEVSRLNLRHGRFNGVDGNTIIHGDSISIRNNVTCDDGYTVPPNISYVSCNNGILDPPTFECIKYEDSINRCPLSKNVAKAIRYRDKCYLATKGRFQFRHYHAKTFCQSLGPTADLAMIPDKETNEAIEYLMKMVPGRSTYWIGAMWNDAKSRWEWPNESELNYTNWKSGEGSMTANLIKLEECAVLTSDGGWKDTPCWHFLMYKAICEITVT